MHREAQIEDKARFLELVERNIRPDLPVRQYSGSRRAEYYKSVYEKLWECDWRAEGYEIWLAENDSQLVAYAVLFKRRKDHLTDDYQTLLYDHYGVSTAQRRKILLAVRERSRQFDTSYLVAELDPQRTELLTLFAELGYAPEQHRLAVRSAPCRPLPEYGYKIRPAKPSDQMFMVHLNGLCQPFVLPAGRQVDLDRLTMNSIGVYLNLLRKKDPKTSVLILTEGRLQTGYLILKIGTQGEGSNLPFGYIYDLAVLPEHWGRLGVLQLVRTCSDLLFEQGIALMIADISVTNLRALSVAKRNLGFKIEWTRYAISLKADAI